MLNATAGANIVRRQRLALIASRAYGLGNQLARDPEHAILKPQLAEIKRLTALARGGFCWGQTFVFRRSQQEGRTEGPAPAPQPSPSSPAPMLDEKQ
jgi:hypothetical protein